MYYHPLNQNIKAILKIGNGGSEIIIRRPPGNLLRTGVFIMKPHQKYEIPPGIHRENDQIEVEFEFRKVE